jgi:hypothetical protein
MAKAEQVLGYLIPTGGWAISGDDFDSIYYDEGVAPITKKQFDDTLKIIDKIEADKAKAKAEAKETLLEKLGITADEAKLLLG